MTSDGLQCTCIILEIIVILETLVVMLYCHSGMDAVEFHGVPWNEVLICDLLLSETQMPLGSCGKSLPSMLICSGTKCL